MAVEPVMPDVDFAADPVHDLEERLATLRERCGRIAPVRWKGETAWVVLRYADVAKCIGDDEYIPAAPEYRRNWDTQGAQPLKLERAEHRASRGVLEVPFKPAAVRKMIDSLLVPLADRLIDEFGDRREADLVHDYTRRYTFLVMSTILGIPVDEEERADQPSLRIAARRPDSRW
jgi:cytochrome P450